MPVRLSLNTFKLSVVGDKRPGLLVSTYRSGLKKIGFPRHLCYSPKLSIGTSTGC